MLKFPLNLNKQINPFRNVPALVSQQIQIRNRYDGKANPKTQTLSTFQNEVTKRQAQAKKTIFIETKGDTHSNNEIAVYFSSFSRIQNIFQIDLEYKSQFLVEFADAGAANWAIRNAYHPGNHFVDGKIRTKSRFFTFSASNDVKKSKPLSLKRETGTTNRETIFQAMRTEKTIDDQILKLFELNRLSDLSSRLRFLTALQIEEAISGIFHQPQVLPFGSSTNGFGRMQSDLDMVLVSNGNRTGKRQLCAMNLGKPDDVPRNTVRNNLYAISSMARHWLHGVNDIQPVLNARVPIIKYTQTLTGLDCDLSMGNFSGYQMSEMFYTFGELDKRVRPLVFYIRAWAKEFDILATFPSPGLSNFMLTCLVIFFLQRLPKPILPPSDDFISIRETNENIQHITDTTKLNFKTENTSTLSELLVEFLDYYSSFKFGKDAASIATGTIKANIGSESMYIYNPLDNGLNVSRNVSDFERNQFVEKCRTARDALIQAKIDAVELLEFYNKNLGREKIDSFVNNMTKNQNRRDRNGSAKFKVKTVME